VKSLVDDAALVVLSLLTGAMLLVGVVLVPFWRAIAPEAFLDWFGAHAPRIQVVGLPLGLLATALTLAAAGLSWGSGAASHLTVVAAVLILATTAAFVLYFLPTNSAFIARAIPPSSVKAELARWAAWHWLRVVLGALAVGAQLAARHLGRRA
jgi:hypothetical protein